MVELQFSLTTLPNRIILLDRIAQARKNSNRTKQIGALLFFDLDRFKLVNDSLGHDIGDILLQSVAKRLEECARENDTVSRWGGGDEFVILLTDLSKEEDVIPIVTRCLRELETVFVVDKYNLREGSTIPGSSALLEMLKLLLKIKAEKYRVAPKLIATSADLEIIARSTDPQVPALQGWRREVFGNAALALKAGEIALGIKNNKISLIKLD